MKNKLFFRKVLSFGLAAVMAVSSIVPTFGMEDAMDEVTVETEVESEREKSSTEKEEETTAAENPDMSEEKTASEEAYPYLIMLPNRDDIRYCLDETHYASELSTSEYEILLYEEGELVQFDIDTELEYHILDAAAQAEYLSMDAMNEGKVSFEMPSFDLELQVIIPENIISEESVESDPEYELPETVEVDPEYELPETVETDPEYEAPDAAEDTDSEYESGDENDAVPENDTWDEMGETRDDVNGSEEPEEKAEESETSGEVNLMEEQKEPEEDMTDSFDELEEKLAAEDMLDIFPENEAVIELDPVKVWKYDEDFDVKTYKPAYILSEYVDITYVNGEIELEETGIRHITYRATWKENPDRSWLLTLPVEIVVLQGTATVGSEGYLDLMYNEQSEEFTGIVPKHKEEVIQGNHYTVYTGEEFDLKDLNLDYDLSLYNVGLFDAGNFDPESKGFYEVLYEVNSYYNPDYRWKVRVTIEVTEKEFPDGCMTVYVKSGALKTVVSLKDGSNIFAGVGTNAVTENPIDFLTVTSVRNEEIYPVVSILKNGAAMDDMSAVILSQNLENNIFTADFNENMEIGSDSYVVIVDFPNYDPTANGTRKASGGLKREEAYADDDALVVAALLADGFDGTTEETIAALADSSTIATQTFDNIGSIIDMGGQVWNYNPPGWAYNEVKIGFNNSFLNNVTNLCSSYDLKPATALPDSAWTSCYSGQLYAAWPDKSYCSGTDATVSLLDTDGDGKADRVTVLFHAYGRTNEGYQSMKGSFSRTINANTGKLKIVKYTSSPNFVKFFDTVKISTSFGIYDKATCGNDNLVTTLKFEPGDAAATSTAYADLDPGTYYVQEISRCPGHRNETATVYGPYKVEAGQTTEVNDTDTYKTGIGNEAFYFKSTIVEKVDSQTGSPVEGAIFKITATICETNYTWYLKTDSKGRIGYDAAHKVEEWNGNKSDTLFVYRSDIGCALPVCTIKIQEVEAPAGYLINPTVYTMKLSPVKDANGKYTDERLHHDPIVVDETMDQGFIEIQKYVDSNGSIEPISAAYSLEGAVYGIYEDAACQTTPIQQLATDANGHARSASLTKGQEEKTYYVKEIQPPKCGAYELDPTIYKASISTSQPVAYVKSVDGPKYGSLSIQKTLKDNNTNEKLSGIHFTMTHENAAKLKTMGYAEAYTDANGRCEFKNLVYGIWYIQEDPNTVPAGYKGIDPLQVEIGPGKEHAEYTIENVKINGPTPTPQPPVETPTPTPQPPVETPTPTPVPTATPTPVPSIGYVEVQKYLDNNGNTTLISGSYSFEGASYGIYTTPDCSGNPVQTLTTDAKGYAKSSSFTLSGGEFSLYVKEIKAPACGAYELDPNVYTVKLNESSLLGRVNSVDGPKHGSLVIQKSLKDNVTNQPLKGIHFTMTHENAAQLKGLGNAEAYTDEKGICSFQNLVYGTWTLAEDAATVPKGYRVMSPVQVVIGPGKENVTLPIENIPMEGYLIIKKVDAETGKAISRGNATFKILNSQNQEVEVNVKDIGKTVTFKTNAAGEVRFAAPIPAGNYTLKEVAAPAGYQILTDAVAFTISGENTESNAVLVVVKDAPLKKALSVTKIDQSTGKNCGSGFSFKVVAAEDIVDGSGAVRTMDGKDLKAGTIVDSMTTDQNGVAVSKELYIGKYYVQETTAKDGYKVNPEKYSFELTPENTQKDAKLIELKIEDEALLRPIQITKLDSTTQTRCGEGFTFEIRSVEVLDSTGKVRAGYEKGTVVDTITTGKDGIATSKALYTGIYEVKETKCAAGYLLAEKVVTVEVKDENKTVDPVKLNFEDTPLMKQISVTKIDQVSGARCGEGFTFQVVVKEDILDSAGSVRVVNGTSLVAGTVVDTIKTDKDGVAVSKKLYLGKYYVQENIAKEGYLLNEEKYEVTLDTDPKVLVVEMNIEDAPVMRPLQIMKLDADSKNPCGAGVEFEVRAVQVVDAAGNAREGFEKDALVETIRTNEKGIAKTRDLYVGTYSVRETKTIQGYILSDKVFSVEVKDEAKTSDPVVLTVENVPLKKTLAVTKIDAETGNHCGAGYKFNVVAAEDVKDGSLQTRKGWEKDAVVDVITTKEDGIAASKELYLGKYYVQEIEVTDDGYAINKNRYSFELTDEEKEDQVMNIPMDIPNNVTTLKIHKIDTVVGKDLEGIVFRIKAANEEDNDEQLYTTDEEGSITVKHLKRNTTYLIQEVQTIPGYNLFEDTIEFAVDADGLIDGESAYGVTITNQPNEVHISKVDITNNEELPGASLVITDSEGNVYEEWVSTEEEHVIYEMPAGTYTLTEKTSPDGYEVEESIEFEIVDSLVVQKITMKDSPYRKVEISKKDITNEEELPGATLTVKDAEGNTIDEWISTEEPHMMELHSGLYTLTETKPSDGFVTADTIEFEVVKTSEDDYEVMPVVMYDEVTKLVISKKDITSGEELPGAHLIIKDEEGEIIDEWTSTEEEHYIERLPIGKYTLTEITAPDGYEIAEVIEFEITDTPEIQHVEMFDSPYREVVISKKDITNSKEIKGAHLQILDAEGTLVEEWISGDPGNKTPSDNEETTDNTTDSKEVSPHYLTLPSGKYTLVETLPADGYVTANRVEFEVLVRNAEGDMEVQTVEMFDDVTKVQISKQDITNEKELPGATLIIKDKEGNVVEEWVSTNEPHYIEKLPIGEYTLTEVTAPNGYNVAETITFKVEDTPEIQHVMMYDSPKPTPTVPKTGDELNVLGAVAIGVVILLLLGTGFIFIRKGKRKAGRTER